jgi:putative NADPH-quinone reductase
MSHALVVVCGGGTVRQLARRAADSLQAAGRDVVVLDLEELDFGAIMSPEEHRAYHTDQPILDPMVAEHAHALRGADILVFVYESVLGTLPARLKGWFERVMVPGVAFRFNRRGKVRPALTQVRRVVGIATYTEPRWRVWLVNDNGRRIVTRALRLNTGWRTRARWVSVHRRTSATAAAAQIAKAVAG